METMLYWTAKLALASVIALVALVIALAAASRTVAGWVNRETPIRILNYLDRMSRGLART